MTKRDYELIAGVLRDTEVVAKKSAWDSNWRNRDRLNVAMADALEGTNPRFNRERFLAACEGRDSTDSAGRKVSYS